MKWLTLILLLVSTTRAFAEPDRRLELANKIVDHLLRCGPKRQSRKALVQAVCKNLPEGVLKEYVDMTRAQERLLTRETLKEQGTN